MRFENTFAVDAPIDEVWKAVLDVERVAPTVPGAQVLERTGDDAYKVAIKVKVGPMSMTYRGDVEVTDADEAAHRAGMKVKAKESRGQGTANADVTMVLTGDASHTTGSVTTEVELSGKVATMGQGVLQDVSGRIMKQFAGNLAAMLEGTGDEAAAPAPPPPAPPEGAAPPPPPPPPKPRPAPPAAEALDLGSVGGAMVADRLRDPKALGGLLGLVALIAFWLGRRSA
ncbi:MAG TPA: SRPBCC family protein [Solirubrobacteraceae bacterium]|jgi:carbon monoxide dehydrogenase subunit G